MAHSPTDKKTEIDDPLFGPILIQPTSAGGSPIKVKRDEPEVGIGTRQP